MRLTLSDVSHRSGVTIAQLSRIENGLADPRLSTLARILAATGATVADIVVDAPSVIPLSEVLRLRQLGRERIERSGVGVSDVGARLERKEQRGEDTTTERAVFGTA